FGINGLALLRNGHRLLAVVEALLCQRHHFRLLQGHFLAIVLEHNGGFFLIVFGVVVGLFGFALFGLFFGLFLGFFLAIGNLGLASLVLDLFAALFGTGIHLCRQVRKRHSALGRLPLGVTCHRYFLVSSAGCARSFTRSRVPCRPKSPPGVPRPESSRHRRRRPTRHPPARASRRCTRGCRATPAPSVAAEPRS